MPDNLPSGGYIMSPKGCIMLPFGLEATALRPSGSNMQPFGNIIFGPQAVNFQVSRGQWCRVVTTSALSYVIANSAPNEKEGFLA